MRDCAEDWTSCRMFLNGVLTCPRIEGWNLPQEFTTFTELKLITLLNTGWDCGDDDDDEELSEQDLKGDFNEDTSLCVVMILRLP